MKKKLLAMLLSLVMVVALFPAAAFAEEPAGASTLSELMTALANESVTEVNVTKQIIITEDITIDGNGKTVTAAVGDTFKVSAGKVTFKNITVTTTGACALWATGTGVVTLENGATFNSTAANPTICTYEGAAAVINIKDGAKVLSQNNNAVNAWGGTINIEGGLVETYATGRYAAAYACANGTINVTGGVVKESNESHALIASNTGNAGGGHVTVSGAAAVEGGVLAHEASSATAAISGGTIKGAIGTDDGASLTITGGTFDTNPSEYVNSETHVVKEADGKYIIAEKVAVTGVTLNKTTASLKVGGLPLWSLPLLPRLQPTRLLLGAPAMQPLQRLKTVWLLLRRPVPQPLLLPLRMVLRPQLAP